jgi:hypothetical protein
LPRVLGNYQEGQAVEGSFVDVQASCIIDALELGWTIHLVRSMPVSHIDKPKKWARRSLSVTTSRNYNKEKIHYNSLMFLCFGGKENFSLLLVISKSSARCPSLWRSCFHKRWA